MESSSKDQHISQDAGTPSKDSGDYDDFDEFDDEYLDSDMEGSILNRPRPKKSVRASSLPNKSKRRASRILDTLASELKSLESGTTELKESEQDPHELYLSSEEDASESADDYENSLLSCDDEDENRPSSSSRTSHEDTARIVSFRFAGKPQVVEINIHHQPKEQTPEPRDSSDLVSKRSSPPPHYPASNHRLSTSSTNSSVLSSSSDSHKSSKMANLTKFVTKHAYSTSYIPDSPPSFLASDPCPTLPQSTPGSPPKTSTKMWKSGGPLIQRTISAARKRPSMPRLNPAYTAGVVEPKRSSLSLSQSYNNEEGKTKEHGRTPTLEELRREEKENMEQEAMAARNKNGSLNYTAVKPPQPPLSPVPMSPRSRTYSMTASMLAGLGKKKSLKGN